MGTVNTYRQHTTESALMRCDENRASVMCEQGEWTERPHCSLSLFSSHFTPLHSTLSNRTADTVETKMTSIRVIYTSCVCGYPHFSSLLSLLCRCCLIVGSSFPPFSSFLLSSLSSLSPHTPTRTLILHTRTHTHTHGTARINHTESVSQPLVVTIRSVRHDSSLSLRVSSSLHSHLRSDTRVATKHTERRHCTTSEGEVNTCDMTSEESHDQYESRTSE